MAGNIQNVSFVNPMDPGGSAALQVQQQAIQRQQALAQALQESSFQDDKVAPGSRVSWTQGLARLANALVAHDIYKKTGAQQVDLATKQGNMLGDMFGIKRAQPTAAAPQAQPAASQSIVTQNAAQLAAQAQGVDYSGAAGLRDAPPPAGSMPMAVPGAMDRAKAAISQPGFDAAALYNTPPADGQGLRDAPMRPDQMVEPGAPPPAVQMQPQASGQPTRAPMALSGDPMQDYTDYSANPQEYTKALIASHAPVDMAKTVAQAQAALERGDMPTATALLQSVQKQNYIAPMNVRQGGMVYNPITRQVELQTAQAPEGSMVNYGPDGKPVNITPIAGGTQAIAAEQGAKTAGANANTPISGYDAQGNPVFGNALDAAHGGAGSPGGLRPAPPLGAQAAANVTATNSANAFQAISDGAADVPNRIYALKQMTGLVADPHSTFGPGSQGLQHFQGALSTLSQQMGIPFTPNVTTNGNEFNKWAAQYSARSAQDLGLSGSDAARQMAVHATPNGEMTRQALQSVIPQMIGIEHAKQGYANAAINWQHQHGASDVQAFRTEWNKVYNPAIYTHMVQGPQAFAGWVKGLSKSDAAHVREQYVQLKGLGALPQ